MELKQYPDVVNFVHSFVLIVPFMELKLFFTFSLN